MELEVGIFVGVSAARLGCTESYRPLRRGASVASVCAMLATNPRPPLPMCVPCRFMLLIMCVHSILGWKGGTRSILEH
jgi:hypothetical protein